MTVPLSKVWVESEYYLNLESESKKRYKEKLTLSNGGRLPDPNALDVGWKEEVYYLPDHCFADIFNYLITHQAITLKRTSKRANHWRHIISLFAGMSTTYYITRLHRIPNFAKSKLT